MIILYGCAVPSTLRDLLYHSISLGFEIFLWRKLCKKKTYFCPSPNFTGIWSATLSGIDDPLQCIPFLSVDIFLGLGVKPENWKGSYVPVEEVDASPYRPTL